jgi:predicted acetyltransferase
MHYRSLTEADLDSWRRIEGYSFHSNPDRSEMPPEKQARFRALFVGGVHAAQLELIPMQVQTGLGGMIAAAGIGSVASAPELRRRGHVTALLRECADELRQSGVPLAILFPFKRSFYGRYGWATFMEYRVYQGPPALFSGFKPGPGSFSPVGVEQIDELDAVYRGALRGRFGPLLRDAAWWRDEVLHDWDGKPYLGYLWRDEQGRARSYLLVRAVPEPAGGQRLACREIVALDPQARAQLFAFLGGHVDQVATVRFKAPADAPVNLLLADPLDCTIEPHMMLRLLDVQAALAGFHYPKEVSGQLTIAVRDDWINENNAVFALELGAGHAELRRLPADSPADLGCDVRVLAQLYSRYLRPRTAAAFGALDVHQRAGLDLAEQLFAGLAPFNSDYF